MQQLLNLSCIPLQYENPDKLDKALESIPPEVWSEADVASEKDPSWGYEDHLVMALLKWFKKTFQWVNNAHCDKCGCSETRGIQPWAPYAEEHKKFGASVVERYECSRCHNVTEFPRYNDPVKLLETRKGRCGEWANAATLLLRAIGRDVRYIWNSEDHVWNEIWSTKQNRWVHVDSCEQAFDRPLIYTDGWGKKMAYVLAFSVGGCADVTRRYVRRPEMQLKRDRFNETQLEVFLETRTVEMRAELEPEDQVEWFERSEQETKELAQYVPTQTSNELPRQSGDADWTKARGEAGSH